MKRLFLVLFLILFIGFENQTFGFTFPYQKQTKEENIDEISQQARILYAQNDIDGALAVLKNKPEGDRTAQDWLLIGNIMQDKEKIDEAVFMFNQSILVDPKFYKAHYNLGYIYLAQDKNNMALVEFKKAVRYNPEFAYGYYNIGCAYLNLKNYRAAKYNFFKALDLKANEPNIYYNLAYTYKMLNKEKQAKTYLDLYNKMMEEHEL